MAARIALIDSGVNLAHPHLRECRPIELGPTITGAAARELRSTQVDRLGHGTCVAAAILDLAADSTLYSIQVFEQTLECPFERVLEALSCALEWRPDIVNLSLGTTDPIWRRALEELERDPRVQIVTPASYAGLPSFPGSLDGFAGVLMDANLPRDRPELRAMGLRSMWYASPYPRDLPNLPRSANFSGPSLAVANVTGFLARSH